MSGRLKYDLKHEKMQTVIQFDYFVLLTANQTNIIHVHDICEFVICKLRILYSMIICNILSLG